MHDGPTPASSDDAFWCAASRTTSSSFPRRSPSLARLLIRIVSRQLAVIQRHFVWFQDMPHTSALFHLNTFPLLALQPTLTGTKPVLPDTRKHRPHPSASPPSSPL
ncbi:hypothetical protein PtA15_15A236 [Puccinia triticina]|uniref:Uncharacterized protein n=1 Tax=Puccinia triticina TaxID=208348 RepID=A0ABY7D2K2_9BASI|nr:uncharacterized protein PtA15_15A236 [Puccinia triticina]WAQ91844.1 hypothetical protein PtA15_15A236 [Puccinia triticina]